MQLKKADLTHGPITKTIFAFAVPLIIGTLVQNLFNMADQIVLGQMAGSVAVASVGACSNSIHVVISTLQGLSVGVTVLLSRALGAGEHERTKRIITTSIITAVGVGVIGAVAGIALSTPLLHVTNCPENAFEGAKIYITIYLASAPVIILYNFSAAILRVTGDSKRPSMYLIIAGLLNVVLNILLCLVMTQKVAAVAIATLASQALGAFLTIRRLCKIEDAYRLDLRHLVFDGAICGKIMRYGIPGAVNMALYPLANLLIQSNVNAFDPVMGTATAGYASASSLNSINSAVSTGFSQTTSAIVGQNIGANQPKRVHRSIFLCMLWGLTVSLSVTGILMLLRHQLLALYLPDSPESIEYGLIYMSLLTVFYFLAVLNNTVAEALNAYGYSLFTSICSLVATILFRPLYIYTVFAANPTFRTLIMIFTISWVILLTVESVVFSVIHIRYLHGKLKQL